MIGGSVGGIITAAASSSEVWDMLPQKIRPSESDSQKAISDTF